MHQTTVYLKEEEVEQLRQLAAATGWSRVDLIREAIRGIPAPYRRDDSGVSATVKAPPVPHAAGIRRLSTPQAAPGVQPKLRHKRRPKPRLLTRSRGWL